MVIMNIIQPRKRDGLKWIFLLIFGVIFSSVYAQSDTTRCNELPLARPEVKATCTTNLSDYFQKIMPSNLEKGEYLATFKLTIDCHGAVTSVKFQNGSVTEENQTDFSKNLQTTMWKPALDKGKNVTSIVFIQLNFTNGQCTVTLY